MDPHNNHQSTSLENELYARVQGSKRLGRINYFFAYFFLVFAVAASALASIFVASGAMPKEWIALLAAVPGIILLINNTFKFEARSNWWWAKFYGLDALYRALIFEKEDQAAVSKKLTQFLNGHEVKWPSLGSVQSTENG